MRPEEAGVSGTVGGDAIQRGYTISIWRGRHVAEPTYDLLGNSLPHLTSLQALLSRA